MIPCPHVSTTVTCEFLVTGKDVLNPKVQPQNYFSGRKHSAARFLSSPLLSYPWECRLCSCLLWLEVGCAAY